MTWDPRGTGGVVQQKFLPKAGVGTTRAGDCNLIVNCASHSSHPHTRISGVMVAWRTASERQTGQIRGTCSR
jgi:hypothetical protein